MVKLKNKQKSTPAWYGHIRSFSCLYGMTAADPVETPEGQLSIIQLAKAGRAAINPMHRRLGAPQLQIHHEIC